MQDLQIKATAATSVAAASQDAGIAMSLTAAAKSYADRVWERLHLTSEELNTHMTLAQKVKSCQYNAYNQAAAAMSAAAKAATAATEGDEDGAERYAAEAWQSCEQAAKQVVESIQAITELAELVGEERSD